MSNKIMLSGIMAIDIQVGNKDGSKMEMSCICTHIEHLRALALTRKNRLFQSPPSPDYILKRKNPPKAPTRTERTAFMSAMKRKDKDLPLPILFCSVRKIAVSKIRRKKFPKGRYRRRAVEFKT